MEVSSIIDKVPFKIDEAHRLRLELTCTRWVKAQDGGNRLEYINDHREMTVDETMLLFPKADHGYLANDWGSSATKMSIDELRARLEERDVVYSVALEGHYPTFFPKVRTRKELKEYANAVRSMPLD